jgi:hypothetical protein
MKKRIGYVSAGTAAAAAVRRRLAGLDGSGQQCGPVELLDGTWCYWTAHDYFHPSRRPGSIVLPRRKPIDLENEEKRAERLLGRDFLYWELGITPKSGTVWSDAVS